MTDTTADPIQTFKAERTARIAEYPAVAGWQAESNAWLTRSFEQQYMYNFEWLGRPIIQLPGDMVAFQEAVWETKPDLIIETGIAHGGSLILSASLLAMIDYCEAAQRGALIDPAKPKRTVLGIDIDIRAHNRAAIEAHPMASRIEMFEGSSTTDEMGARVRAAAEGKQRVLVVLDSNHTHEHVLCELELYAPLATKGSYCMVFDTVVEDMDDGVFPDRSWRKGDNPKTAVWEYLKSHPEFEIDQSINRKLLISAAPDGWLKRIG